MIKNFENSNKAVFNFIIVFMMAVFLTQCEKEPLKGWEFYHDAPPKPNIENLNGIIKDCVPPYPVTFYQETKNLRGNVTYNWDFGDGNTSTDQNPTHIYEEPGDYTVQLVVSNEIGFDTAYLVMSQLSESSIPVKAGFSYNHFNDNRFAPNKVLFENLSSGANQFYWYFGDGKEINHDNPEHVYQNAGNYNVTLRGTCSDGSFDETTQQVFITPSPKRIFIDSINLMLPSGLRNNNVFIEIYHNTIFVGATFTKSPRDYPVKYRRPEDFPGGYFFDNVQYTSNEVFKFVILKDKGENPPDFLYEITLAPADIQNNFYPGYYYQLETVPLIKDVFIDLYLDY